MRLARIVLAASATAAFIAVPSHALGATTTPAWSPTAGTSWQWQLDGTIDTSVNAAVYDIDYETSAAVVTKLHSLGRHVVCYVDVGSWENERPDASKFPSSVKGKSNGWPGEKWLDIRKVSVLQQLMAARFDICKSKGFDAIEPDNVDGYTNSTGFPLKSADQLTYNRMIAGLAHDRGLSVALKNDVDQATTLQPAFDFTINEQCHQYSECSTLKAFVAAHKAVLNAEYSGSASKYCGTAGFSTMKKHESLDAWRQACP